MKLKTWLKEVAYKKDYVGIDDTIIPAYYSKFDDSYITFVDMEDNVKFLAIRNITEQLTHGVGFSPKTNEWFGWSYRAIAGFTIGSEVKKGDCAYIPNTKEDFIENSMNFWYDEYHEKQWVSNITDKNFTISYTYNHKVPNKTIRGTTNEMKIQFPESYGNGEWIAKTMEDAKQMAIDFNESVS